MYKVQLYASAIRKLFYGLCVCMGDNPLTPCHKPLSEVHFESALGFSKIAFNISSLGNVPYSDTE